MNRVNSKFQNIDVYQFDGSTRKECRRCKIFEHNHLECRTDISKRSSHCKKIAYVATHCRQNDNRQSTLGSNPHF